MTTVQQTHMTHALFLLYSVLVICDCLYTMYCNSLILTFFTKNYFRNPFPDYNHYRIFRTENDENAVYLRKTDHGSANSYDSCSVLILLSPCYMCLSLYNILQFINLSESKNKNIH